MDLQSNTATGRYDPVHAVREFRRWRCPGSVIAFRPNFPARRGGHAWRRGALSDASFIFENFVFCPAGGQRDGADTETGNECDVRVSAAIQLQISIVFGHESKRLVRRAIVPGRAAISTGEIDVCAGDGHSAEVPFANSCGGSGRCARRSGGSSGFDINNDGTLQTPLGAIKKMGN